MTDTMAQDLVSQLVEDWEAFTRGEHRRGVPAKGDRTESVIRKATDAIVSKTVFVDLRQHEGSGAAPASVVAAAKGLLRLGMQPETLARILDDTHSNDEIRLPSLFGKGPLRCNHSTVALGQYNFLLFREEQEVLFIVQRIRWVELIWIPSLHVVFSEKTDTLDAASLKCFIGGWFLNEYDEKPAGMSQGRAPHVRRGFGGLLCTFHRPYHYFYQVLSGLESLHGASKAFPSIPRMWALEGGAYSSPARLYGLSAEERLFPTEAQLNAELKASDAFLVSAVTSRPQDYYEAVEHRIRGDARLLEVHDPQHGLVLDKLRKQDLVLWLGLMGERRVWDRQVEGVQRIITRAAREYSRVGVILDGLTSPEVAQHWDTRSLPRYHEVEAEIRRLALANVTFFSTVGATAREKVSMGLEADFFMADMATSSMFIARFCGAPGVAHRNKVMNYGGHRHPATVPFPDDLIVDGEGSSPLLRGYDIDPESAERFFFSELNRCAGACRT